MKTKLLALLAGASLVFTVITTTPVSAGELDMGAGPQQEEIDNSIDGGWSDSATGVAGRPYLIDVYLNGDGIMTSDQAPQTEGYTDGWRLLINPNNVCHEGQSPAPGVCYADPNRVSFNLVYLHNGDTKNDFAGASLSSLGITEEDEFEFVIGLNEFADDLGWTWVSGTPTYWNVEEDVVTLKVHPASKPSTHQIDNFCSTIPVSTCSTQTAADEILTIEFVMSFDDTLNSVFDGTLFASTDAVIASLETAPGFDPATPDANSITYGMAAPHEFADGTERSGTFYALLSNDQLAAFGVSDPSTVADALKITRSSSDSGTFDSGWETWTADANGTDGQLLTLTNISFSVPKFTVNNGNMVERNVVPKVKIKKSRTIKNLLVDLGILASNESVPKKAKVTITVKPASKKICVATKTGIKGLKVGSCKYSIKIKLGNQTANKSGSFKVIK